MKWEKSPVGEENKWINLGKTSESTGDIGSKRSNKSESKESNERNGLEGEKGLTCSVAKAMCESESKIWRLEAKVKVKIKVDTEIKGKVNKLG